MSRTISTWVCPYCCTSHSKDGTVIKEVFSRMNHLRTHEKEGLIRRARDSELCSDAVYYGFVETGAYGDLWARDR